MFKKTAAVVARRGADVLLEVLRSEGVEYIFGNPGATELPLMDALGEASDIKYVLALQEASAVAMADGYAQAAGKPGFLNLHTAGGLGHGMGNLLNASVSQTPLPRSELCEATCDLPEPAISGSRRQIANGGRYRD